MRAQGLVLELRGLFEAKDEDGQVSSPDDADLLPVLAALDKALADTVEEDAGPTSFLDTVTRLVGRLSAEAGPRARPLIVEP
jgi:hypothetical protein